MKVKVSYTVEADEIPKVLNNIACTLKTSADAIATLSHQLCSSGDYGVKSLNDIGKIKKELLNLDGLSADFEGILSGFLSSVHTKPHDTAPQQVTQDAPAPNIGDIMSKLEQLKSMAPIISGQVNPEGENDDNS